VDVPDDLWSVADRFLFDGRIIEALEHLREVRGLSLQDAIVAVDERVMFSRQGVPSCSVDASDCGRADAEWR
jgi:hypothetical protein